jgi:hypothetical protein
MTEATRPYSKKRAEFGRHPNFEDSVVQFQINIAPNPRKADAEFELRDPVKQVFDNIPKMTEHSVSCAKI